MKKNIHLWMLAIIAILTLISCKKDPIEPTYNQENLAPLSVEFDNIADGRKIVLGVTEFTNAAGETYSIDRLQYYISNISVEKSDGTLYVVPQEESYFLIREHDRSTRHARVMVPEGDYVKLHFMVGVDSARNTMGIDERTGVLDPTGDDEHGMYWSWNSGYIFFKFEGISPEAPLDATNQNKFRFHIGGYGGYNSPTLNNTRMVSIDLEPAGFARVRKDRVSNIHLMVDVNKALGGPNIIAFSEVATLMAINAISEKVANNFASMFYHDHTEN